MYWKERVELGNDPEVPSRVVALFYAPEVGEGLSSLCVEGITALAMIGEAHRPS